jgi:PAS domain S-box-containing protein
MASYPSILASWSVRKKLLAAAMVMFLSAGSVIVWLGMEKRSALIARAKTQAMLIVDGLAVQQKEIAMGTEYLLSALAGAPAVQKRDAAACNDLFGRMKKLHPFFTAIEATTPAGVLFASSGKFKNGTELSKRRDIREAIQKRRFSAGNLTVEEAGGGHSVSFAYPVQDENGRLVAVLSAGFRIGGGKYAGLLARMHLLPGSTVNYVDRNGLRFWRLPDSGAAAPRTSLAGSRLHLLRGNSDHGYFEQHGADGVLRIYAYAQLRLRAEASPYMYILIGMPEGAVIGQANRAIAMELLALGVIGLVALLLTLLFGDIAIARPIGALVLAAQRIGRGEGTVRTGLPHTVDELGRLAQAFDDMAELLEKKNAERELAREALARAYAASETIVRKRTAELSESNAALAAEIAERKLAEEERERLVTAIEQSADAIIITDTDCIISYVNPAFTVVTGYRGEEAIGRHLRFLKSERHGREFYRGIRETLTGGAVWSGRVTNRKKDGSLYETEATVSPVRNESGAIISFVAGYRDITERLKLERDLRQAHKMEALGAMAGGIAHDFKNILTAILGNAEIALYHLAPGDPARPNLENVQKACGRAADLVKRILAFTRRTEHSPQPVHVFSLVEETLKLLSPSLPAGIRICKDAVSHPEDMVVLADPTEIHQVLINLCTNAVHAMLPEGGVLLVGLSRVVVSPAGEPDGREHVPGWGSSLEPGQYVCLTVRDTGVGIAPAVIEKIFDPYFTTKPVGEGTGLGLSVVQGIVRANGGAITVESQPGKGATFRVFLRAINNRTPVETKAPATSPGSDESIPFPGAGNHQTRGSDTVDLSM